MSRIFPQIIEAVGATPLVRLNSLSRGLGARVLAKLESITPLGSVKDRIGVAMLLAAEDKGLIRPGPSLWSPPAQHRHCPGLRLRHSRGYRLSSPCRRP